MIRKEEQPTVTWLDEIFSKDIRVYNKYLVANIKKKSEFCNCYWKIIFDVNSEEKNKWFNFTYQKNSFEIKLVELSGEGLSYFLLESIIIDQQFKSLKN